MKNTVLVVIAFFLVSMGLFALLFTSKLSHKWFVDLSEAWDIFCGLALLLIHRLDKGSH